VNINNNPFLQWCVAALLISSVFACRAVHGASLAPHVRPIYMSAASGPDERVVGLLGQVNTRRLLDDLRKLTGEEPITVRGVTGVVSSRNTNTFGKDPARDLDLAMAYVEDAYSDIGIATTRDPFTMRGARHYNIIAEIPGKLHPNKVLIIGSHIDSTAGRTRSAEKVAPGADDDASGTVAVLHIARALSKFPLNCTVRFVHFSGEEQGLYGSTSYSQKVAKAKTQVVAMIQLDMVGYCRAGKELYVHDSAGRNNSHPLALSFINNVKRYGLQIKAADGHTRFLEDRSDHAGFLDQGYTAVLLTECNEEEINPNYHSTSDRVATLNLPYLAEVVKLTIATGADLAGIRPLQ
jgi:hypothetical protein